MTGRSDRLSCLTTFDWLAQVPLRVLPGGIKLLPWGSWSSLPYPPPRPVQILLDRGPWTMHEPLPPFRLVLQERNTTVLFSDEEEFFVGVRLFRKEDMLDITAVSLEGATIQQVPVARRRVVSSALVLGGGHLTLRPVPDSCPASRGRDKFCLSCCLTRIVVTGPTGYG